MKTAVPCYNFLYSHASPRLRSKIDKREQEVDLAEREMLTANGGETPGKSDKVLHVVNKTIITKRIVNLFILNMSEKDQQPAEQPTKDNK
jgi:hypothetical protein